MMREQLLIKPVRAKLLVMILVIMMVLVNVFPVMA